MSSHATKTIRDFYKSEMNRSFEKCPYIWPLEANKIHWQLNQKCIEAYKRALEQCHVPFKQNQEHHLKELLAVEFASFKETNSFKVGSTYEQILDATQLYFQKYSQQIKEMSKSSNNFTDLENLSLEFSRNKTHTLKQHIEGDVPLEPVKGHVKTLQHHIDKVWKVYQREHDRKTKVVDPPPNNRNSIKIPTANPNRMSMPEPFHSTIPQPSRMSTHEPFQAPPVPPRVNVIPPTPTSPKQFNNDPKCLAYLISTWNISCAAFHHSEFTPILYNGRKHAAKFVIGEENGSICFGSNNAKWFPGKDLETLRSESNYDVTIQGKISSVKIEFLIAFALSSLKSVAERQTQTTFNKCVVCVPMTYSSAQRYRVQNASFVAGFSTSKIISDISAAAYHFGNSQNQPGPTSFIVVKQFCHDAEGKTNNFHPGMFTLDKAKSKLEMTVNRVSTSKIWKYGKQKGNDENSKARVVIDEMMATYVKKQHIDLPKNVDVSESEEHKKLFIHFSKGWRTVFKGYNIQGSSIENACICLEGALNYFPTQVTIAEKAYYRFYTVHVKKNLTDSSLECTRMRGVEGKYEVDLVPGNMSIIQILSQTVHQKIGELLVPNELPGECVAVFKLEHGILFCDHSKWKKPQNHLNEDLKDKVSWKQNYSMSQSKMRTYQQLLCDLANSLDDYK